MKPKKTLKKNKKTKKNKVNEEELLEVINIITKKLAYKFKFGYHDIDDMKQQITVFALEGLKNYDHKRPLENFLWTHVRNRLFNYKRDNYQRPNKPCLTCPLYDPHKTKSYSECTKYDNKDDCALYHNWSKRNITKKNLMHFTDIESAHKDNEQSDYFIDENNTSIDTFIDYEILKNIENKISNEYREIYLKIKNGAKVPKSEITKLINHIKTLIDNNEEELEDE
jgi:DNA-directed RNA polymerase specialized sigma24 family protein